MISMGVDLSGHPSNYLDENYIPMTYQDELFLQLQYECDPEGFEDDWKELDRTVGKKI